MSNGLETLGAAQTRQETFLKKGLLDLQKFYFPLGTSLVVAGGVYARRIVVGDGVLDVPWFFAIDSWVP